MRKSILLILLTVAAVTVSLAAYYRGGARAETPQFTTAPVTRGDVVENVEAAGTLKAVETVEVGSQVSGTIKSLNADFNSRVKRGEVIARLEPSLLQTQLEQSQASLLRLQAELQKAQVDVEDTQVKLRRARELWDQQLIPRTDLETAEAAAKQAEASLKSAQAQVAQGRATVNQNQVNLNHTIIQAPIDGIVISRNVEVGQTVAASMSAPTLFVIARDLTQMQVNANVDESDIGRIHVGQPVSFRVDAYPDATFRGTVAQVRLEPVVQSNVVSYVTVINVPNRELRLKPGMTADVTIEAARAEDVLRVPNAALRFRPAGLRVAERGPHVWVNSGGQLEPVRVDTGVSDGMSTAILDGTLAEHAQVVTGMIAPQGGAAPTSGSPLLPFGGRRPGAGRQGGAPGGPQGVGR